MKKLSPMQSMFLDYLRAIAAQLVLLEHVLTSYDYREVFVGSFGVVIFFVLSGFLIAMSVERDKRKGGFSFRSYLVGRFSRIYTLYIPVLIFAFLVDTFVFSYTAVSLEKVYANYSIVNFVGSIFMLQQNPISEILSQVLGFSSIDVKPFGSARPIWSVAIEWWIYVFFGMCVFLLGKFKLDGLSFFEKILALFSVLVVVFNSVTGIGHNLSVIWFMGVGSWYFYGSAFFSRLEGIPLSVSLALLFALIIMFAGRFVHMEMSPMFKAVIPYDMVMSIIFLFIFITLLSIFRDDRKVSSLGKSLGVFGSNISYALYLTHFTVLNVFYSFGLFESWVGGVAAYISCNVIAYISYSLFDRYYRNIAAYLREKLL